MSEDAGQIELHGILTLPARKQTMVRPDSSKQVWTSASDSQPDIVASVSDLRSLQLEPATDNDGTQLWSAFVGRHHYLGYRPLLGAHPLFRGRDRRLGCLLIEAATKTLAS